jgi:hypothetical protein
LAIFIAQALWGLRRTTAIERRYPVATAAENPF